MSCLQWQDVPFKHHDFSVMHTLNVTPTASAIVNSYKKFPTAQENSLQLHKNVLSNRFCSRY